MSLSDRFDVCECGGTLALTDTLGGWVFTCQTCTRVVVWSDRYFDLISGVSE